MRRTDFRRSIRHHNQIPIDCDNETLSIMSRPISLDLHTYRHQETLIDSYYNKENFRQQQFLTTHPDYYLKNSGASRKIKLHSFKTQPILLDASMNSSLSDENEENGEIINDEDVEAEQNDSTTQQLRYRHGFYSTSDLTTSDSEICKYPLGENYR